MNSESPGLSHGLMLLPLDCEAYLRCLRNRARNSEIASRAVGTGALRVVSGPRCGSSFRKMSAAGAFYRGARLDGAHFGAEGGGQRDVPLHCYEVGRERQQAAQQSDRGVRRGNRRHRPPIVRRLRQKGQHAQGKAAHGNPAAGEVTPKGRSVDVPAVVRPTGHAQLVREHVVGIGCLGSQRGVGGATLAWEDEPRLGVPQPASLDEDAALPGKQHRPDHAQHAVERRRIDLAAPLTDVPALLAALAGAVVRRTERSQRSMERPSPVADTTRASISPNRESARRAGAEVSSRRSEKSRTTEGATGISKAP